MADQPSPDEYTERRKKVKTRLIRGIVAIGAAAAIFLLISSGIAEPSPDLQFAYFGCGAVAVWGLIDLVRAMFAQSARGE